MGIRTQGRTRSKIGLMASHVPLVGQFHRSCVRWWAVARPVMPVPETIVSHSAALRVRDIASHVSRDIASHVSLDMTSRFGGAINPGCLRESHAFNAYPGSIKLVEWCSILDFKSAKSKYSCMES